MDSPESPERPAVMSVWFGVGPWREWDLSAGPGRRLKKVAVPDPGDKGATQAEYLVKIGGNSR